MRQNSIVVGRVGLKWKQKTKPGQVGFILSPQPPAWYLTTGRHTGGWVSLARGFESGRPWLRRPLASSPGILQVIIVRWLQVGSSDLEPRRGVTGGNSCPGAASNLTEIVNIFIHRKKTGSNTKTQQYKHKSKKAKTTTKSITVADTVLEYKHNVLNNHLYSPQLVAKLAHTIHCRNTSIS